MTPFDESNLPLTTYIKEYVSGINNVNDVILNAAIKRYFVSQKTMAKKKLKDPNYKEAQARKQRKLNKLKRRRKTVATNKLLSEEKRKNYIDLIQLEYLSSESEAEDENGHQVFQLHIPNWRANRLTRVYRAIDESAKKGMSSSARRQYLPRIEGRVKICDAPKVINPDFGWIVKKQ
ncbi:uncharacterized protein LOC130641850 [Hydractinia symbiolongicarpus]|uniref:uncharacterized protein LOC130641850 n=1 Tax=Hydractinia symbiolongicarpus TaxID=13093 RepID=UPI00255081F5|nr:uncharacterized protein LOC130641850 [Hydractinia symbiolongicarpus]XP_057304833.1 uncharacterized protein LOC130641850 [Hydractinia symbiolongicarpus]